MKVLCDDKGYVSSFALIGDLLNGIDVPEPENITGFLECTTGYKIVDGVLIKDEEKVSTETMEVQKAVLG